MREFVFTDASLGKRAGQFVWLEVNTEDGKNAAFLETLTADALPTFAVIDPRDESIPLRYVGSLTVKQLHAFLDEGRILVRGGGGSGTDADRALRAADRAYGAGRYAQAAEAYRTALGAAPPAWPSYNRAVESLVYSYQRTKEHARCLELAQAAVPRLGGSPSELVVGLAGLDCALALGDETTGKAEKVGAAEAVLRGVLAKPGLPAAADDVSGAYGSLIEARKEAKDAPGARGTAEQWAAYLEGEAAKARTPGQRTVFDSHRLSAYLELEAPDKAVSMLQQSERDFPSDYNPPARLAVAYQAMKRWDEAIAASDRALRLAYGPRKLRVYGTKVDVLAARGDVAGARRTLEEALACAEALPGPAREQRIAAVRKKMATLPSPAP